MKNELKVFPIYTDLGRKFCFAVLDLDQAPDYPANFVCLLPTTVSNEGKVDNAFFRIYGKGSLEQAKLLLTEALKNEAEPEVKVELERRLTLLEPKTIFQIKCCGCGKLFQPRRVRRFKKNFCKECFKKYVPPDNNESTLNNEKATIE
jgi:hypothetical protein